MTDLVIENHPELLQEYGRAVACINAVEEFLGAVIRIKDKSKTHEQLGKMTLGVKVGLIQAGWLKEALIEKLKNLNENRIKLVHGVVGEIVDDPLNPHKNSGRLALMHNKEAKLFDKAFLQKISEDAKEIIGELYQALPIPKAEANTTN